MSDVKNINEISKPKGTRDMMPSELRLRRYVEGTVRNTLETFCFEEIQTPIFEYLSLFQLRSGDKIKDDMYWFSPPSAELKEEGSSLEYCLRPELTAATCRFYVGGELSELPKPVKAYYMGPCFRYDTPGPGRYREFYQAGVELIGSDSPKADAEVVTLATAVLDDLEIEDYRVQINDIGIFRALLSDLDMEDQNKALGLVDKYGSTIAKFKLGVIEDTTEQELYEEYMQKLLELLPGNKSLVDILYQIIDLKGGKEVLEKAKDLMKEYSAAIEAIEQSSLNQVFLYLEMNNVSNALIDFSIARGLDYYTGIVFEIDVDSLKGAKQICGGGRYDKLIGEYGGVETPATGFAFGLDRLVIAHENAMKAKENFEETRKSDLYIVMIKPNPEVEAQVLAKCRRAGIRTEVDLLGRKSMKANLNYANKIGVPFCIIMGPKEIENGVVVLRDMGVLNEAEQGSQVEMPLTEAIVKIIEQLEE
ncbi:MAG: histidine--tRNA ligase [Candidatus Heimdallarchaeota archaeon]|nr:histidine--tRNA ligase [Candidatus Heimdallarchaeota archaeon]